MKSKGASLYILNVPGVGMIEAHMSPSQALRFVASVETQLDEKIPRSLRIAPATLGEIETREALLQARETLTKALNNSVTGGTIADAISVLDRVLAIPKHPPLAPAETETLRAALEAAVAWAAPMADAPKSSRPEWFDQARAALSHKGPIK